MNVEIYFDTTHKKYRDITEIRKEEITIKGEKRIVQRQFTRYNVDFFGVGMIIDEDIMNCMICGVEFGFFTSSHHCRCCGNVVCETCSPHKTVIHEMKKLGPQRVCVQCYWGQVIAV